MYERNYKRYTWHCFTNADYNMGLYKITKGGLMSILNDYRKYSSNNEEEKEEWKQEVKEEYRRQEMYDRQQEEKIFYESEEEE